MALARIKLEDDIRRAFEAREFEMHYQPIVALKDGRLAGFEALMRWRRKDGSLVPPVEFIPLAEETGLIVELGRWAMERAIKDQIRFAQCIDGLYPGQPPSFMSQWTTFSSIASVRPFRCRATLALCAHGHARLM